MLTSPTTDDKKQGMPLLKTSVCEQNAIPAVHHAAIQQIHDILRFAIAVYGVPYHTGSFSTMLGVAMTFTIHKEKVESLPKAVKDRAVTDILYLPPSALKLSRWSSRATEVSYAVLVEHIKRRIVLSFRGTMTDGDILTDICGFGESFCGGLAHQGAARTVNALFNQRASIRRTKRTVTTSGHADKDYCPSPEKMEEEVRIRDSPDGVRNEIFSLISNSPDPSSSNNHNAKCRPSAPQLEEPNTSDDLLDTLEKLAYTFPSYKIIITGHSLGGGVAVLFAIRLSYERFFPLSVLRRIHVISFGPMPTLTLPAAGWFDEGQAHYLFPIWTVVNGCDIVPRLQINSLHRLLGDICKGREDPAEGPTPPSDTTISKMDGEESSHQPDSERSEEDPTHELYHPGRIFLMTSPCDSKKNCFFEVPRGHKSMHEAFLMRPMFYTHMIDNYMEGLINIRSLSEYSTN
ncbi:unnamed protein product [Phytomonas sp. Hart1]|nr:unnamed protein product [Phytomonas sp. Hart1]|eukprot:CCW70474.1 unnamed protein product [Phytomonas sp. isolate Hart1]